MHQLVAAFIGTTCLLWGPTAHALTAGELLAQYQAEAARPASASQGNQFYHQRHTASAALPSCSTCHTDDPLQAGIHKVTNKAIAPLSPKTSPERFTDRAKTEKWFRRNCVEVVGRECTSVEKANFLAFVMGGA
jgi:cytochrome c peroxidase